MSFNILQTAFIFLAGILFTYPANKNITTGYKSVINFMDGFIATGTGGQVDWISISGKITRSEIFAGENFNSLLAYKQKVVVGGERGSILVSSENGIFRKIDSGTENNINSLAEFRGLIIAGADQGEILTGDGSAPFRKKHLQLKGNIVSVSSSVSDCYGVTDQGEIIYTKNGSDWEVTDFNKVYSGYYKPCYFKRILVTENRIAVTGVRNDGSPVMMFSSLGRVWTERTLYYTDYGGEPDILVDPANDIFYDQVGDQFFIACDNGKLMKLPSCSQCNEVEAVSAEDLTGIASYDNRMIIVGSGFFIKVLVYR